MKIKVKVEKGEMFIHAPLCDVLARVEQLSQVGDRATFEHLTQQLDALIAREREAQNISLTLNGSHHGMLSPDEERRCVERHQELRPYL